LPTANTNALPTRRNLSVDWWSIRMIWALMGRALPAVALRMEIADKHNNNR
jgi:hypothetical protein